MRKNTKGFTIVELLIVIVVIGILAAITIVAYNGIQTRAKNAKTTAAASAWVKALKLYNADKGTWPTTGSCLGTTSTYVGNGGQCWDNAVWIVNSTFLSQVQPYMSNLPEPDITDVNAGTAQSPRRGLMYNTDNSTYWQVYLQLVGSGSCPSIGIPFYTSGAQSNGSYCVYTLN